MTKIGILHFLIRDTYSSEKEEEMVFLTLPVMKSLSNVQQQLDVMIHKRNTFY